MPLRLTAPCLLLLSSEMEVIYRSLIACSSFGVLLSLISLYIDCRTPKTSRAHPVPWEDSKLERPLIYFFGIGQVGLFTASITAAAISLSFGD